MDSIKIQCEIDSKDNLQLYKQIYGDKSYLCISTYSYVGDSTTDILLSKDNCQKIINALREAYPDLKEETT